MSNYTRISFYGTKTGSHFVSQPMLNGWIMLYTSELANQKALKVLLTCVVFTINPLRPNSDPSQTSLCNIKGLLVREVMRIKNMITQVQFY